jgi:NAD(P)-dependent dehydrogenase (short-subunit alcohol dehydrogenase family)
MQSQFAGKVALVTGGSRGLGVEIVRAFAARGATVVIASRKLGICELVAARVRDEFGTPAHAVELNVGDWDRCTEVVDAVYAQHGHIDVLVNNAGASPLYPSLDQVSAELFDKVVAVNLRGPFRLTALIGTRMMRGDGGSIVNIGSIEAIRPDQHALPYAAAKAGLATLSVGFAQAFGPSVRVNTVQPGAFLTAVSQHWPDEARARYEQAVALRRCGEPAEIVGAVMYFASDASSFATGAVLRLDGGWN